MPVSDRAPIAALDDARRTAADLLWPPVPGRWVRLVVLVFMVGGLGGASASGGNLQGSVAAPGGAMGTTPTFPDPGFSVEDAPPLETVLTWVGVVVGVLLLLFVVYSLLSAVAEFVLVAGIRDGSVSLRAGFLAQFRRGVRLFGFRFGVWTVALVLGLLPAGIAVGLGATVEPLIAVAALPLLLVLVLTLLPAWLVVTLTTDLVVPTMLAGEARGPTDGWGRLRPVLSGSLLDVVGYLVVKLIVGAAAKVGVGLVAALLALVAAVPFAAVGSFLLSAAGDALSWEEFGALLAIAMLYSAVALGLVVVVRTPVVVYLKAYAMATLGRLDPDLDLLGVAGTD